MTNERFNEIVNELQNNTNKVLLKKKDEYNLTDDRLDVFNGAAARQKRTVPQAVLGYMDKHIGSIYDYVLADRKMTKELAQEKIGDALNYLYLLYAALEENGFAVKK